MLSENACQIKNTLAYFDGILLKKTSFMQEPKVATEYDTFCYAHSAIIS
jgi:hypothetical protein